MLRNISLWQWLLILLIVLLLFGARRLPDLARSVGQSLKILKTEVKDATSSEESATGGPPDVAAATPPEAAETSDNGEQRP